MMWTDLPAELHGWDSLRRYPIVAVLTLPARSKYAAAAYVLPRLAQFTQYAARDDDRTWGFDGRLVGGRHDADAADAALSRIVERCDTQRQLQAAHQAQGIVVVRPVAGAARRLHERAVAQGESARPPREFVNRHEPEDALCGRSVDARAEIRPLILGR